MVIWIFILFYVTGAIFALGIAVSTPPINKSRKIDINVLILTIVGSWFSLGICIGVILEYLQDILEELEKISTHRR
jgi:hypothetical protein